MVRAMEVTAVGKFSHLYIDGGLKSLDFGPVYVGKSAEKTFVLKNESPVGDSSGDAFALMEGLRSRRIRLL